MSSTQGQASRLGGSANLQKNPPKTDFMQTQTFHRRNMSNLIRMQEDEDVPDHMLISRGGPLRRTLKQIEQDLNLYGEEGSPKELMDSQDSAADNDFQDFNSNLHPEEPQMPKDGFIDMVEHPSILDDDENQASEDNEDDCENEKGANSDVNGTDEEADQGEFPLTERQTKDATNLRLDMSDSQQFQDPTLPLGTPQNQMLSPHDQKMELSELHSSEKRSPDPNQRQSRFTHKKHSSSLFAEATDTNIPNGEISQATNESCSSLETAGNNHLGSQQQDQRKGKILTPNEAYGNTDHNQNAKDGSKKRPLQVYQYYPNDDEDDFDDQGSPPSQLINTASPSPTKPNRKNPEAGKKKKFQMALQIEIDSDREDRARQAPPSAPKQGNYIHFEEVKDTSQQEDVCENIYGFYGGKNKESDDVGTPGLPRDGQIMSQKMLTPNEQRMHQSYFHHNPDRQRDLPSTKSYQTPVTHSAGFGNEMQRDAASPYLDQNNRSKMPFRGSLNEDSASVSTMNPQYYYQKTNGQIGFAQQSQSRASDCIYEKAPRMSSGSDQFQQESPDRIQERSEDQGIDNNRSNEHIPKSKEDHMEAEIRRLEELNRIDAQRLREPMTTDEESPKLTDAQMRLLQEEETKANCPDEYNLLEATESNGLDSVELLKNTTNPDLAGSVDANSNNDVKVPPFKQQVNSQQQQQQQQRIMLQDNEDLNDRESFNSGGTGSHNVIQANRSYGTSHNGGKHLYVITEESTSMVGGQTTLDPSRLQDAVPFAMRPQARSGSGYKHEGGSDPYCSQEQLPFDMQQRRLTQGSSNTCKVDHQRSPPLIEMHSTGEKPKTMLNRTMKNEPSPQVQTFNDYCENDQNENDEDTSEQKFVSMSQIFPSNEVTKEESSLELQHQRSRSQHLDLILQLNQQSKQSPMVLQTKQQHRTSVKEPKYYNEATQSMNQSNSSQQQLVSQMITDSNNPGSSYIIVQAQPGGVPPGRQNLTASGAATKFKKQGTLEPTVLNVLQQSSLGGSLKDQELMSVYLKQSMERRTTMQNNSVRDGLEIASDEDLLGSNFDRISKILPNHDLINEQLPDFNGDERSQSHQLSPPRRNTGSSNNDPSHIKVQMLMSEIAHLQQVISQRNQVIMIKDNTINELKQEYGVARSSLNGMAAKSCGEGSYLKDVACLAHPDTRDVKCQTYGPRKQAYYKSIPAKIQTGLPSRSQDSSQERIETGQTTIIYANQTKLQRHNSFNRKATKQQSPVKHASAGVHMSNSQSPGRRRLSPRQYQGDPNTLGSHQTREDVRSLRFQLTALKEQLRAQEEDTENYIAKVTYQEKIIETQEKNYDILQLELEENRVTNANLVERNEELVKQVDSLLAEHAELKAMKSLSEKSNFKEMLMSHHKAAEVVEFGCQTDESKWQEFINQIIRSQQPDLTDTNTVGITSARSGNQTHHMQHQNMSLPNNVRGVNGLGVGLFPSSQNSRVLEHFSDVISGEQGTSQVDYDRLQNLIDKANSYEMQQTAIEKEIIQYKRLLQEVQVTGAHNYSHQSGPKPFSLDGGFSSADQTNLVTSNMQSNNSAIMLGQSDLTNKHALNNQQQQQPTNLTQQHPNHMRHPSNITTTSPLMNLQDYMNSGTVSFEFNKNSTQNLGATGTGGVLPEFNTYGTGPQTHAHTSNAGASAAVVSATQQQLAMMQNQSMHYKKKAKKLQKRVQKLEFEKMSDDKTIQELQMKIQELNERYRDLRQKYQLKLQEKNLKISELKQQINRQIFTGGPNSALNSTQMAMGAPQQPLVMMHPNTQFAPQHTQHLTSNCDLSVSTTQQRHITPVTSNGDLPMVNISHQEDNKGTALAQQNRAKAMSVLPSNEGDFYNIVSGMVDQRIAETSYDNRKHSGNRSKPDYQVNNRGQTIDSEFSGYQQRMKKGKYPKRPDLEILRDTAKLRDMSSPSNQPVSQSCNSADEEPIRIVNVEASNRRKQGFDSDALNDRESSTGTPWNQQFARQNKFLVTNSSSTAKQLMQQSRNSRIQQPQQIQSHEDPRNKHLMTGVPKRNPTNGNDKQKQVMSSAAIPSKTLAESFAQKRASRKRSSEAKSSPPTKKMAKRKASSRKQFRSKSSEKRDHSLKSAVSKDDVMPCYKHLVPGRKRNEVEYYPSTSLLTYLAPNMAQQHLIDENSSSARNNYRAYSSSSSPAVRNKYPRNQKRHAATKQQTVNNSKISQMIKDSQQWQM